MDFDPEPLRVWLWGQFSKAGSMQPADGHEALRRAHAQGKVEGLEKEHSSRVKWQGYTYAAMNAIDALIGGHTTEDTLELRLEELKSKCKEWQFRNLAAEQSAEDKEDKHG